MIKFLNSDFFDKYKLLRDNSVDLFLVDPPYFIGYDKWDGKRNSNFEFENFFRKLMDIIVKKLNPSGTVWFFMAKDNLFANKNKNVNIGLVNILEEYGCVNLDNWLILTRNKGRGSEKKLKSTREDVIHFTLKNKGYKWNNIKTIREVVTPYIKNGRPRGWFINENGIRVRWTGLGNVWMYSFPQWNGIIDKQIHNAQKPFMVYERLIKLSTDAGDLIVDPFTGSGTSLIVSKYLNRKFIGYEIDKEIYDKSKNNIIVNYKKIISEYEKKILSDNEI